MVKHSIQIFARVKPTKSTKAGIYEIDEDEEGLPRLQVTVPKELASGFINNKKENYKFRFNKVFDQKVNQNEIFANVAQPVIDNVFEGYNGTIFAYGQTGSGKTFTITGGAERYADRGIIPRSLSYIFDQIAKNPSRTFTVHVSYLEIYNENGFDLLDPKHEATKLEDLPKVSLLEDSDQNIHLKNLSVSQASSEEDALNLLFMGDTNRMIAETPMNMASSRSHCIFTVHLTSKLEGSATIRRAKLHLVDLAGSERVAKTGVNGTLLTEAKHINLSLHFLEAVIIALSEKNRSHVPYRNSMMTSVLRDSLGGNCMTTMIATCSVEKRNLDESISTCRFAQRVAMIKNDVLLNEELDPRLLIAKLKQDNQELRQQIAMATGEQMTAELTHEDVQQCEQAVQDYLDDPGPDCTLNVGHDLRKIRLCFQILKKHIQDKPLTSAPQHPPSADQYPDTGPYRDAEAEKLKQLVEQRDNEINILVNMLKKERQKTFTSGKNNTAGTPRSEKPRSRNAGNPQSEQHNGFHSVTAQNGDRKSSAQDRPDSESHSVVSQSRTSVAAIDRDDRMKTKILGSMSLGRQEAFDSFMREYQDREKIEANKQMLKQRYQQAKLLGETLNKTKLRMNHLKNSLTQIRTHQEMEGPEGETEIEVEIKENLEAEKKRYKDTFTSLRSMKSEIEHLQHFLEKSKVQLMKDFELWWAEQTTARHQAQNIQDFHPQKSPKVAAAWNTPPVTPPTHASLAPLVPSTHGPPAAQTHGPPAAPSTRTFTRDLPSPDIRGSNSSRFDRPPSSGGYVPGNYALTGDSTVDADIQAFIKARQTILQKAKGNVR